MRYSWLTLVSVLLGSAPLYAQPQYPAGTGEVPAPAVTLDPEHNRLDALLLRWQAEMNKIQTLAADCRRIQKDKTFGDTQVFEGTARYMRPNMAMLEMRSKSKAGTFEKYICNGRFLYVYLPQEKVIQVHELPQPRPGQVSDDNFLSFLFGMRAEEAKRRYDLKLTKEDEYWLYIQILPRLPLDKADFHQAQMVLSAKTFLPRRLWFEQPNGNEITWELPQVVNGAPMQAADFTNPAKPVGWTMVKAAPPGGAVAPGNTVQPRLVRPHEQP